MLSAPKFTQGVYNSRDAAGVGCCDFGKEATRVADQGAEVVLPPSRMFFFRSRRGGQVQKKTLIATVDLF